MKYIKLFEEFSSVEADEITDTDVDVSTSDEVTIDSNGIFRIKNWSTY